MYFKISRASDPQIIFGKCRLGVIFIQGTFRHLLNLNTILTDPRSCPHGDRGRGRKTAFLSRLVTKYVRQTSINRAMFSVI